MLHDFLSVSDHFGTLCIKGLRFDSKQKGCIRLIHIVIDAIDDSLYPAGIYLLKVNNRNTRTRCERCSKLTIKIPERYQAWFWYLYC